MLLYQLLITIILAALLLNTINNLRLLRRPRLPAAIAGSPLVSILVPARNEARSIARCVEALARQEYPHSEILVLDDQSEDETAAIVARLARRHPHLRLLHGQPLPPNWHGKAYACAQLAQAARGEWLLFVDADTELSPGCVSTALRHAQARRADLLTLMPMLVAKSFGEALLLPIIPLTFVAFLPLGLVTNHPSPLFAGALGPFLLFRRASYQRIGGHASVRTDIVEDMQLSRLVKRQGGCVVWMDGTALLRVRLYHGFREAWHGIAKSSFAAINYSLLGLLLGVPICVALFWGPYGFLAADVLRHPSSRLLLWLPLAQILLLWSAHLLVMRRFRLPPVSMLLQAGTALAIVLTTLYSAAQTKLGHGVAWKGRTYHFDALPRREERRIGWAAGLVGARLLIALLLVLSAWPGGGVRVAEALLLLGWTLALLEHTARRGAESRWVLWADVAGGAACLGYLGLSGQLSAQVALPVLLLIGVGLRWFPWPVTALLASLLPGSILLITAEAQAPSTLLRGWSLLIALLASRSLARQVIPWLQRFRSP
ncbi:MAG TPA: glycosyltransferase family 2 protein [Ktedonobacterales bacterium]